MKVRVRLGEPFWRAAGQREAEVELAPGATVADALAELALAHPGLRAELEGAEVAPALFMDEAAAGPETHLVEGATIHVVWPVSGGCTV